MSLIHCIYASAARHALDDAARRELLRVARTNNERLGVTGMLLSNEPGYYRQGEWGIRIENLIIINPPDDAGFLSFETVTHCPIDKRLVVTAMLNEAELAWLDAYHSQVEALLMPLLLFFP